MRTLPVHRIIPFSNVEGMGNRTSIFVQGCNANCLYCHNSETIPMKAEGVLVHTVESLLKVIKTGMPFIRGITVSGGEATLYHKFLTALFEEVHKLGLTCYVDTNGFFDEEAIRPLVEVTDKFLYDIKAVGTGLEGLCFSEVLLENDHRAKNFKARFVEGDLHLKQLKILIEMDKVEEVRLVHVKGFYEPKKVVAQIAGLLKDRPDIPFKLIRAHTRGLPKERLLLLKGAVPSKKEHQDLADYAREAGVGNLITIE